MAAKKFKMKLWHWLLGAGVVGGGTAAWWWFSARPAAAANSIQRTREAAAPPPQPAPPPVGPQAQALPPSRFRITYLFNTPQYWHRPIERAQQVEAGTWVLAAFSACGFTNPRLEDLTDVRLPDTTLLLKAKVVFDGFPQNLESGKRCVAEQLRTHDLVVFSEVFGQVR